MKDDHMIEPDLAFIEAITRNGGESLKKCFQCATCSVACKLSPESQPFPRKEMLYASWGLKDRLLGNPDIWLCHHCGDCSNLCPRGAKPGDTLAAIRQLSIQSYNRPRWIHRLTSDARLAPLLIIIPALIILCVGLASGLLRLRYEGGPIVYTNFFPVLLIEMIFIPLSVLAGLIFAWGIRNFMADMHTNYTQRGIAKVNKMEIMPFVRTFVAVLPSIIKHDNFAVCTEHRQRKRSHMLVAFSFVGLACVAGAFVFALYVLNSHGPYDQLNPIKMFANVAGLSLITGAGWLIKDRLSHVNSHTTYFDGYLIVLTLSLGVTGMLTQFIRLGGWPQAAMVSYFIHLVLAFNLIAFLPYSKMAHLVYRTAAVAYNAYARK